MSKLPDYITDPDGVIERNRQADMSTARTAAGCGTILNCLVLLLVAGGLVGGCAYLIGWAGGAGAKNNVTETRK